MLGISRLKPFWEQLFNIKKRFTLKLTFRTWLFFVTSLFIIGIGIYLLQQAKGAKAAWFDSQYTYRQRIPISNAGSAQTDFQVGITLNTSSLISASKMQSDCDDLRIVNEDGELLPFWIQEQTGACNTTTTKIWTKIPSIPTTDTNIYIYYGNSLATNAQQPEQVFLFFDNFNGTALNTGKWGTLTHTSGTGASYNILGGTINFTTTTGGGYYWLYSKNQLNSPYTIEANVRNNYATNGNVLRMGQTKDIQQSSGGNVFPNYSMDDAGNSTFRIVGDTTALGFLVTSVANASTSGIWRFEWPTTGSQIAYLNDTSIMTGTNTSVPSGNSYVYFGTPTNATFGTVTTDWIFARKYAATAPTLGAFGSEEIGPEPVGYWKMDEGYGTTAQDSSGNGNNGSFNGAPTWQNESQCISGKCLSFDGTDDAITTVDKNEFSPLVNDITISVWAKVPSSSACGSNTCYIMSKGTTGQWEWGLFNNTETSIHFVAWNSSGSAMIDLNSPMQMNDDKWHHYAVTLDYQSVLNLYVDGEFRDTDSTWAGAMSNGTQALQIGRRGTGQYFRGYIDEPKIFPFAKTAEQIKADYIKGASGKGSAAVLGMQDQSHLSNGLVGFWKMDENTGVGLSDSSGNNNLLTASSASWTSGKFASGWNGTGSNYLSRADDDDFDFGTTENFTISLWFKSSSATNVDDYLVTKYSTGSDIGYYLAFSSGLLNFTVADGTNFDSVTSTSDVYDALWHHVSVVKTGTSKMNIYIDGVLHNTDSTITTSNFETATLLYIGDINGLGGGNAFNGVIDELRIYNRAFSQSEISQLYQWAPGPVAYWDFNENTSTTANDKSGNGYTGTITGAQWVPGKYGSALKFNGVDYVDIASPSFPGIAGHITLSMWVNGDAALQPQTNSVFEGYGVGSTRVLNAHLPWSNSNIYWDAGPGTAPYDRINAVAPNASFEGEWNHWTFTKDISSGSMKIYLNGSLFHSGVGNTRPIGTMTNFRIGSYVDGTTNYDGLVDDFRIYNYERTPKQIIQDMNGGHPAVGSPVASAIAHWKLDEGVGSTIYNSGSVGATLNAPISGATWTNDGKIGKALSFDGVNDSVTITDTTNTPLDLTTSLTFSLWINPSDTASFDTFLSKIPVAYGSGYELDSSNGSLRTTLRTGSGNCDFTAGTLTANTWQHIVSTYNGTNTRHYINGVLQGTSPNCTTGAELNNNSFMIGQRASDNSWYTGKLDEIKIYNYALSDEEVKVEFNQGKALVLGTVSTGLGGTTPSDAMSRSYCPPGDSTTCNAPVAEWLFNENVGTTAYDTSGNSRNGSFGTGNSMPKWGAGIQGSAALFDGTGDLIDTSTELSFSSATSYSVSGWLKPALFTGGTRYALDRTTSSNEIISLGSTGSNFIIQIRGDDGVGLVSNTVPSVFTSGQWTFFTVVRNVTSDTITTYINGQAKASVTDTTTGTNSPTVRIGNHSTAVLGWGGLIDQIRFYDYARTQAQISWEYSKGTPVAWYKMDECEGTTIYNSAPTFNDTPAGYNAALTLGASGVTSAGTCATSGAWANGATGKRQASLGFDGTSDYISITDANSSPLDFTTQMSMMAWVKTDVVDSDFHIFIEKGEPDEYELYLRGVTNKFAVEIGNVSICDYVSPVSADTWYHVAAVWDGSTIYRYQNGKLDGTCAASYTMTPDNTDLVIGRNPDTNDDYWEGQIDDVRLFNYPLTLQQIRSVYNNGAVSFE